MIGVVKFLIAAVSEIFQIGNNCYYSNQDKISKHKICSVEVNKVLPQFSSETKNYDSIYEL